MCIASSDKHAQALPIFGGDAAQKKREQCMSPLPEIALQTAKPRLGPNPLCHGQDTSATDHKDDALASGTVHVLLYT